MTANANGEGAPSGAPSPDNLIRVAAREYAARGWRVFPLRGKTPFAGTRGFKDATVDPAAIAKWPADANVGVVTGSGLVVLDVDNHHDGGDTLAELEREYGELPVTVSSVTGGGGQHIFFRTDTPVRNSAGKLGSGLDIRANGGFVVAPPSVHPNGRRYEWDVPPWEMSPAALPDWLERLLVEPRNGKARPASEWRRLAANGASEGARNDSTARLAGHFLARGVDYIVCLEVVLAWNRCRNRPPLSDDEVARVVRSIARRELEKWR